MRSLELSLEGFTSFRSRQVLDFSNLDLFAITGPTGAGKTSLLDAITYALYGHVARFGKDAKASELVSQGSQNLRVSFRFSVRGVEYRVTRTWRYRPKTPETKVLLEQLSDGTWEKIDTKEKSATKRVEQVLGMDFDTFTRVILLPQGKFDEFLKGNASKRREILRQLAGFEIFEKMRQQAQKQADLLKTEYEAVERQLTSLEAPTQQEITQKKVELDSVEQQLPSLNEAVLQAQKAIDEQEKLLTNLQRLASWERELTALNARDPEIEAFKVRLQQAASADQIKGKYALVQDARTREQQAQTAAKLAQEHLIQAQAELAQQKAKLDEVTAEHQRLEPQLKAREEALAAAKAYEEQRQQYQTEVERTQKTLSQRKKTLAAAEKALKTAEAKQQAAAKKSAEAEQALIQYTPGGTRLEQLKQVSPLLTQLKFLQEQTAKSHQKVEKTAQEKLKAVRTHQTALLNLEQAESNLRDAQTALESAEVANASAVQKDRAARLRQILHDGDTCPVCNGIYHTTQVAALPVISLIDTAELQTQKNSAEDAHKAAQSAKTKAELTLESLQHRELEYLQELATHEDHLTALQQKISAVLQAENWDADALNPELERLQAADDKYHQALAEQKEASADLREAEQALQSTRNTHATASAESQAATQEVERWQQQLQDVEIRLNEITGDQPYKVLQDALEGDRQRLQTQMKKATESYQTAQKNTIQAEEKNKQAQVEANSTSLQKQHLEMEWKSVLASAGFTEAQFLVAQANSTQQAAWQKAITDYSHQKVQLETRLEEVSREIGNRTTDEAMINACRDAKYTAEEQVRQANDQRAKLFAWIQGAEEKHQQAEKLSADLQLWQEQTQTYYTLARNLRSDEFQAYILEHLEAELVTRATGILQELTDSRYALKVQDGEYWVEDNWNGGERRRVQTLSGGETFATSLSMALALSEKLSMGAELGSLFLDEGFGTLDADTLESVTQILDSLRQQDRLIGVITHVRGLGERLPTQVKVYKSPKGSQIEVETV